MKAKISQKRGRRTDSVSLDIEELMHKTDADFSVSYTGKGNDMVLEIKVMDITVSLEMDLSDTDLLLSALLNFTPMLVDSFNPFKRTVNKEERRCTECEKKGIQHISETLEEAFKNGITYGAENDRHLKTLLHVMKNGTDEEKLQAYQEAVDSLSDFK